MKHYLLIALSFFCFSVVAQNSYHFSINLTNCSNDKLFVELTTPEVFSDSIIYRLPKIVPGTYGILNFGRFISEFKAFDNAGNNLSVVRVDQNGWKISNAKKMQRVTYEVEDTWDTDIKEPFVFEPAGSNFEKGKVFMLNTHCLFGYFEGLTNLPYQIDVKHPSDFYGTCSLTDVTFKDNVDTYKVSDYMLLQDSPMMYNVPDTTILNVGGAQILISIYSPNKVTSSKFIADNINEILMAQKEYLGGTLPIKKYAYLIYLTANSGISGANGALEHGYSSVYFLPEMEQKYLAQTMRDVSAHEFFHIVTPLNLHAEQIGNFDFNDPEMSKHLWLYEGTTEYASTLVQIKYGSMTVSDYLKVIEQKIAAAKNFNDSLPFTLMSKNCLNSYKDQYANVYQKGALIGLCLDIKLRHLSKGHYGLQELIRDLSELYGKNRSFKDEELFDQIVKLTYPEMAEFFKRYVEGSEALPISEMLGLVGIGHGGSSNEKHISFGGVSVGLNPATNRLMIVNTESMDDFGKALDYHEYDELVKFNGKKIELENAQQILGDYLETAKEGDVLHVLVSRKKAGSSKTKNIKLKSTVFAVAPPKKNNLVLYTDASIQQLQLRSSWIGKH